VCEFPECQKEIYQKKKKKGEKGQHSTRGEEGA
jgi:hypothetical protein